MMQNAEALGRAIIRLADAQGEGAVVTVQREPHGWVVMGEHWQDPIDVLEIAQNATESIDEAVAVA